MKGSPLTIVIIATVVIIGGSIVTYILIESSPQEDGPDLHRPQDGQMRGNQLPRQNVYEDTEPLPVPTPPVPDQGGTNVGSGGSDTRTPPQNQKPPASQQSTVGDEAVRPIPVPPLPD